MAAPVATPELPKGINAMKEKDVACLAHAVHVEARGEPVAGQRAVLEVIRNRMRLRGKSACEVVAEKGQFPWYKKGMKLGMTTEMWTRLQFLATMPPVLSAGAEYFFRKELRPRWAKKMEKEATIGGHVFLREKE